MKYLEIINILKRIKVLEKKVNELEARNIRRTQGFMQSLKKGTLPGLR